MLEIFIMFARSLHGLIFSVGSNPTKIRAMLTFYADVEWWVTLDMANKEIPFQVFNYPCNFIRCLLYTEILLKKCTNSKEDFLKYEIRVIAPPLKDLQFSWIRPTASNKLRFLRDGATLCGNLPEKPEPSVSPSSVLYRVTSHWCVPHISRIYLPFWDGRSPVIQSVA